MNSLVTIGDTPTSLNQEGTGLIVQKTTEAAGQSVAWNNSFSAFMHQIGGIHDTSNASFISYTIPTSRLPELEAGIYSILPEEGMVILVVSNKFETNSYIHIVRPEIAKTFLHSKKRGQRNYYMGKDNNKVTPEFIKTHE